MTCNATTETEHECSLDLNHDGRHVCTDEHFDCDDGDFVWYDENDGYYLAVTE
jgi:hypothetical protein